MNDLSLTEQLRALRQPPPESGFEARLEQALASEARASPAARNVVSFRSARLRRWGGRMGLGMAVALGASAAAAAAGGVWAFAVGRAEPPPPAAALAREHGAPRGAAPDVPAAASPVTVRSEPTPPARVAPAPEALPLPVAAPLPAVTSSRASERKAVRAEAPGGPGRAPADTSPRPAAEELAPFELPKPAASGQAAPGASALRESASRPGTSAARRRALPEVPPLAERGRAGREKDKGNDKRDRAGWPPGREIARERSGLDRAERGLERARDARERKE